VSPVRHRLSGKKGTAAAISGYCAIACGGLAVAFAVAASPLLTIPFAMGAIASGFQAASFATYHRIFATYDRIDAIYDRIDAGYDRMGIPRAAQLKA